VPKSQNFGIKFAIKHETSMMKRTISLFLCVCVTITCLAQNENTKWYFGTNAAVDFMTTPPTILNNSAMNGEGSSIADTSGNLLFYADGAGNGTIWNKQHQVMANGTGLYGGGAIPLIIKHTNNPNLYYVFTTITNAFATPPGSITGTYYSIVDMSLAAGMGSVTVKNMSLYYSPTTPEIHATRHANGNDYWIMIHEYSYNTNNFRAYLLTSSGINPNAVVSSAGPIYGSLQTGSIKFSPTGQKLCIAINAVSVLLYDFDNNTGIVSNPLTLLSFPLSGYGGSEFSADGTKLYAGNNLYSPNVNSRITQWDLSAGSNSAIISSSVNLITDSLAPGSLQLAPNGKIYIASSGSRSLSVINNPNAAGVACNFVLNGQPISAAINSTLNSYSRSGLPNMIACRSNTPCSTKTVNNPQTICGGSAYAIGNHTYATAGTYMDTLQNAFSCNEKVIVRTQLTVNSSPSISAIANATICVNEPVTFTASGANTYTWSNTATGNQYTTAPFTVAGNHTYSVQLTGTGNLGCTSNKTISVNVLVQACDVGFKEKNLAWYSNNIKLFPNPSEADLTVTFGFRMDISKISIVNSLGQTVRETTDEIKDNSLVLQTADLAAGIYLVRFKTVAGTVTKQFVKN
jgi:hypothetical protein